MQSRGAHNRQRNDPRHNADKSSSSDNAPNLKKPKVQNEANTANFVILSLDEIKKNKSKELKSSGTTEGKESASEGGHDRSAVNGAPVTENTQGQGPADSSEGLGRSPDNVNIVDAPDYEVSDDDLATVPEKYDKTIPNSESRKSSKQASTEPKSQCGAERKENEGNSSESKWQTSAPVAAPDGSSGSLWGQQERAPPVWSDQYKKGPPKRDPKTDSDSKEGQKDFPIRSKGYDANVKEQPPFRGYYDKSRGRDEYQEKHGYNNFNYNQFSGSGPKGRPDIHGPYDRSRDRQSWWNNNRSNHEEDRYRQEYRNPGYRYDVRGLRFNQSSREGPARPVCDENVRSSPPMKYNPVRRDKFIRGYDYRVGRGLKYDGPQSEPPFLNEDVYRGNVRYNEKICKGSDPDIIARREYFQRRDDYYYNDKDNARHIHYDQRIDPKDLRRVRNTPSSQETPSESFQKRIRTDDVYDRHGQGETKRLRSHPQMLHENSPRTDGHKESSFDERNNFPSSPRRQQESSQYHKGHRNDEMDKIERLIPVGPLSAAISMLFEAADSGNHVNLATVRKILTTSVTRGDIISMRMVFSYMNETFGDQIAVEDFMTAIKGYTLIRDSYNLKLVKEQAAKREVTFKNTFWLEILQYSGKKIKNNPDVIRIIIEEILRGPITQETCLVADQLLQYCLGSLLTDECLQIIQKFENVDCKELPFDSRTLTALVEHLVTLNDNQAAYHIFSVSFVGKKRISLETSLKLVLDCCKKQRFINIAKQAYITLRREERFRIQDVELLQDIIKFFSKNGLVSEALVVLQDMLDLILPITSAQPLTVLLISTTEDSHIKNAIGIFKQFLTVGSSALNNEPKFYEELAKLFLRSGSVSNVNWLAYYFIDMGIEIPTPVRKFLIDCDGSVLPEDTLASRLMSFAQNSQGKDAPFDAGSHQ